MRKTHKLLVCLSCVVAFVTCLSPNAAFSQDVESILKKGICLACHAYDKKLVGPAFKDVATKYRSDSAAVEKLARKIKSGGSGVWGPVPMPPSSMLTDSEALQIASHLLKVPAPPPGDFYAYRSPGSMQSYPGSPRQAQYSGRVSLEVRNSEPDEAGAVILSIRTNADTASLKINGAEEGGRSDGIYEVKRVARIGVPTEFDILATDIRGNTDRKVVTVVRKEQATQPVVEVLQPQKLKRAPQRDAVAVIIGIQNYKRVPRAEFAADDARMFYDYAIHALGVKPNKIKLLVDADAEHVDILRTFQSWLPSQVDEKKTDVFVFYSGHGLPSLDGKTLYLLPHGVDRDYLEQTAVTQDAIVNAIAKTKPRSVSMFFDSCYSGQTRGGETLLASARPIAVKANPTALPPNFTMLTASAPDQMSFSAPELKQGIFSYYLMKGMEGGADSNNDGQITASELHKYVFANVSKESSRINKKQEPTLSGDAAQVILRR